MCGRYALTSSVDLLVELFDLARTAPLTARYNIAPTQFAPVVRTERDGERRLDLMHWGLIPYWTKSLKDAASGARMINARAETVMTRPAYREAFHRRRCLVPANAFFEWKKKGRVKQPYAIRREDDQPFAMAGLWERWRARDGQEGGEASPRAESETIQSFTILTTEPNDLVAPLHDRMPVILPAGAWAQWLGPVDRDEAVEVLAPLLRPAPSEILALHPVSRRVNSPDNDDPACLEPVDEDGDGGGDGGGDHQPLLF